MIVLFVDIVCPSSVQMQIWIIIMDIHLQYVFEVNKVSNPFQSIFHVHSVYVFWVPKIWMRALQFVANDNEQTIELTNRFGIHEMLV